MSFNGSGTFVINSAGQPVVANTVISATVFNALTADLATGLTNCITKDGQSTPTANIPMGNNKITGLGAGTAATDAATLGQVQSTAAKLVSVTGTDTISGTMSPALTAYAAGQLFYFIANAANTGAMTINIDGLGAKNITRDGSTALVAGDVNSGEIVVICYDGTRFQMINAANSFGNTTINGTLTVTGKSDLPTVSTASINAAVAVVTTGTVTNLTATSASVASMNAGVALLTTATVTTLTATGASIASANIGNLQFTAASIASINAGVAVVTNLTATSASIASMNGSVASITTVNATTVNATNVEVTNVKANDGTAAITIADSTGAVTVGAGATINGGAVFNETGADVDFRIESDTDANAFVLDGATGNVRINNYLGVGNTAASSAGGVVNYSFGTSVNGYGILSRPAVPSTATSNANLYHTWLVTSSNGGTPYTLTNVAHYATQQVTIDADSTITNQYGFNANANLTGATNNYGFYSNIASGSGRYNFFSNGSADNYFAGNTGIGTTTFVGGIRLTVLGGGTQLSPGTTAQEGLRIQRATGYATLTGINNDNNAYNGLQLFTGASAAVTVDTSGNVGIGASSPQVRLQTSTASDGAQAIFNGVQSTNEQTLLFRNSYYTNNTTAGVAAIGWIDSGVSGGILTFKTGTNGGGVTNIPTERVRIDNLGNVGIGGTAGAANKLEISGTLPTSGAVTRSFAGLGTIPSGTTTAALNFSSAFTTAAASFTLTDMFHFNATQPTLGAGSTVTNIYGFAAQSTLALATNTYGFYSNIASGSGRYNFFANGSADNYFAGNTGIGTSSPTRRLDVIHDTLYQFRVGTSAANSYDIGRSGSDGYLHFYGNQSTVNGYVFEGIDGTRMTIDASGNVGIGGTAQADARCQVLGTAPSSSGQSRGFLATHTIPSGTTTNSIGFGSVATTQAASFTLPDLYHFWAFQSTIGSGSTVSNQYGFYVGSSLTGATNNYGFYSNIASAANRWNLYCAGSAQNYFAGNTGVGVAPAAAFRLQVSAATNISVGIANATAVAGAVTFNAVNDANSANIPLDFRSSATYFSAGIGTTGSAANAYIDNATSNQLLRSTSSLRYKRDVADYGRGLTELLGLRPVSFKGTSTSDGEKVFAGLIAEEVHDAGLTEFVAYDKEGRPDALHYGNMVALLVKAVQELKAELDTLKGNI